MIGSIATRSFRVERANVTTNSNGFKEVGAPTVVTSGIPGIRSRIQVNGLKWLNVRDQNRATGAFDMDDDPLAEPQDILVDESSGERFTVIGSHDVGDQGMMWQVVVSEAGK